eukprot:gene9708-1916_t
MERASKLLQHISVSAQLNRNDEDVVILSCKRTPVCRARRGGLRDTPPSDLLEAVLRAVISDAQISADLIGDIVVGNVLTDQAALMARVGQLLADIPHTVPVSTINRQCSSGLQAIATIAGEIKLGTIEIGIGAGVESMSERSMDQIQPTLNPRMFGNEDAANCLLPMGITSENVAERFHISREKQDMRAAAANALGAFSREIVPTQSRMKQPDGDLSHGDIISNDDGIRPNTSFQSLAKLKPAFKAGGTTTAGNSSQVSDGAAAVLLASRRKARELGITPRARVVSFAVCGVPPDVMGIGPAIAIPNVLKKANLTIDDIDVFEINEAFASQAVYCIETLNIPAEKVNPRGGAIALGHPLGCTGARQVVSIVHYLEDKNLQTGVVSMCIGTGMGAAAIITLEN